MNPARREHFDKQLEAVLAKLPRRVHEVLNEVPLYVEDFPARHILESVGLTDPGDLCGLYSGIPLTDRSINHSGVLSDVIYLFREGIMNEAADDYGEVQDAALQEQIRVTILHEVGHHHGLNEDDLEELGYD